jgi:hypothetical protein
MSKRKFSLSEAMAIIQSETDSETDDSEQFLHLAEAADAVCATDKEVEIVIMPPDIVDGVSDEEFVDEDDLLPSNLPSDVAGPVAVFCHRVPHDETQNPKMSCTPKVKKPKVGSVSQPKWEKKLHTRMK